MTWLRLISPQGWVGIILSAALATLLAIQAGKTHHWHKQATSFELKYQQEHTAFLQTILNYNRAAENARIADAQNKARVEAEQGAINRQRDEAYEARIADARARAERLRRELEATAHPSGPGAAPVPGVPATPGGAPQGSGEDRLSDALIATEQAIQLDELIKWVRAQHAVEVNGRQHAAPNRP